MNCSESPTKQQQEMLQRITEFVGRASGLNLQAPTSEGIRIIQSLDQKGLDIPSSMLAAVLTRFDADGHEFIQVNFIGGKKILITNNLIGFKPMAPKGLDTSKLPRVVTTPDIMSVFEAIQEALHLDDANAIEIKALRRIYEAVLTGGESVGFDLGAERAWLKRIPANFTKASA